MFKVMLLEAWAAISANRLRAVLTMLGMIIGVCAVVLIMAIGKGAQQVVEDGIASMGSNILVVLSGSGTQGGVKGASGQIPTLTFQDNAAIEELPGVLHSVPLSGGDAQLVNGPYNWNSTITGATPDFAKIRNWKMKEGEFFDAQDVKGAARIAVLGTTTAENLFGSQSPTGKTIRIGGSPYLVSGVLESKGQSFDGKDQDDTVVIPVTTANRKLLGGKFPQSVRMILLQATSAEELPKVELRVAELLKQRHRIGEAAAEDFTVRNMTALVTTAQTATHALSLLLAGIASISLLVGGIGIMNIMLVSVTERTREIGIRAAIGARRRDILMQFLLESLVLSLIGCVAGVILGVSGAWAVGRTTGLTTIVTLFSILLAFGVSGAVGIFFGYYPAKTASELKPIDALRY